MMERQTQNQRILEYLEGRDWVSAWTIVNLCRVLSLTRRIYELRVAGNVIEMRWVELGGKKHTEYRLVHRGQQSLPYQEEVRT